MKKTIKTIALILIISIVGVLLCGCNALDELRKSQAFFTEDGKILYGETEYLPLPECEELQPITDEEKYINVTAKDVPVLLSVYFTNSYCLSQDGNFIVDNISEESIVYCRSDIYGSTLERIENGFIPTDYYYCYLDYNAYDDYESYMKYYYLTKEQKSAIDTVLSSGVPEHLPEIVEITSEYSVLINATSSDKVFSKYACDLCFNENKYYIAVYKDNETFMYHVPDNMSEIFSDIMKKYIDSENYWLE